MDFCVTFLVRHMHLNKFGNFFLSIQDTSVLSPIISPIVITTTLVYHALYSPSQLVHTHYILFFSAFGIQVTKITLLMMVSPVSPHLRYCTSPCRWQG